MLIEPWGFANALEREYGIVPATTQAFFRGPFADCIVGRTALEDIIAPYLEVWGWPHSVGDLIRFWLESENQPRSDLLKAIAELRSSGAVCALASNQEANRARYIEQEMFPGCFDRFYFSCDLGSAKPDAAYFDAISSDLDVRAANIHFWDDTEGHVDGATRCGWNAYHFTGTESLAVINTLQSSNTG